MGILKTIGSTIKQVATGISQAISGTSSKTIQTPLISKTEKAVQPYVSGFKTAIVAVPATKAAELPGVVAKAATAAKAVGAAIATGAKELVKRRPVATAAVAVAGAGYIANNPTQAAKDISSGGNKLIAGLYNVGGNISQFRSDPTFMNLKNIYAENPVITTAGTVGIFGVAGLAASKLAQTYGVKDSLTTSNTSGLPTEKIDQGKIIPTTTTMSSAVPITPETQIVGKPASSGSLKRYKSKSKRESLNQSVRVNIFNQSRVQSVKYLNTRHY